MNMMKEVTPAQAYLNGMLYAAFCVKVISCDAVEWQIDEGPGGRVPVSRNN